MEKIKGKIGIMFKDETFWILFILTLLFFGVFFKLEFATDTYCVFATPTEQYVEHFMYSGRFFSAGILSLIRWLGLGNTTLYTLSFIGAIICTVLSLYKLYKIFNFDVKSKIVSIILSILIVINMFSIELYLFLEKGILMLSVLFCVLAFGEIVKYFKGNKNKIILAFIYMVLANFCYQGTVGIFVALSVLYIIKYSKSIVEFIKYNVITMLCYGLPALINFLIVKFLFNNARVAGQVNIMESFSKIISGTKDVVINTFNILPKYFLIILVALFTLILIYLIIRKKSNIKTKILVLLKNIYVIAAIFIISVLPQVMQNTSSIGFAPRNTYSLGAIIGIIVAFIYLNLDVKKTLNIVIVSICIILLSVQYVSFENIIRNRYILNYMDYYNSIQIVEKVKQYEDKTKNKINQVAVYKQLGNTSSYPGLFVSGDINLKATLPDWSRMDYLRYYLDRDLVEVNQDENVYNKYFKDQTWDTFDIDQIVLIDNTLHMCTY